MLSRIGKYAGMSDNKAPPPEECHSEKPQGPRSTHLTKLDVS